MGYLETGMRVLDAASALLSRLQELAVLAANDSNTDADLHAIDLEAEAMGDEFHRLMSTSKYKGKDIFVTTAGSEYVSMGGRNAEMTFGIGKIAYSNLYIHNWTTFATELGHANAGAAQTATYANSPSGGQTDTIIKGVKYTVEDTLTDGLTFGAAANNSAANVDFTATTRGTLGGGSVHKQTNQLRFAASEGLLESTPDTNMLTSGAVPCDASRLLLLISR